MCEPGFVGVVEAARMLGLTRRTLLNWRSTGEGPGGWVKSENGRWYIDEDSLAEWCEDQEANPFGLRYGDRLSDGMKMIHAADVDRDSSQQ